MAQTLPFSDKASATIHHEEGLANNNVTVAIESDELPKNYYYSSRLIGTFVAVGINLLASTGGFAIIAPVLGQINQDIGPGPIVWVSLIYTLMLAIGLTLVGQYVFFKAAMWLLVARGRHMLTVLKGLQISSVEDGSSSSVQLLAPLVQ